jgi:hypothetical protein
MRNFKYRHLVAANPEWESNMNNIVEVKSECLRGCAEVFQANLLRTGVFAMMPAKLAYEVRRNTVFVVGEIGGGKRKVALEDVMCAEETIELQGAVLQRKQEQLPELEPIFLFHYGVGAVEKIVAHSPEMQQSMDALLVSIVLESYLFFEAFVSDLWTVAVDNGTAAIAASTLSNNEWEKPEMKAPSITKLTIDPRQKPGSYWRDIGMVSFQSLRSIKKYFAIAFGQDAGRLLDTASGRYIYALAAVRNCIMHRGGKIEGKFKSDTAGFPEFDECNVGARLALDGEVVVKLRGAAATTGLALLQHVDGLLQSEK